MFPALLSGNSRREFSSTAATISRTEGDPSPDFYWLCDPASFGFASGASHDPSGYRGGINLYEYCGDDPMRKVDPTGMWPKWLDPTYWIFGPHIADPNYWPKSLCNEPDCCVTGVPSLVTTGSLKGGFDANSYLGGGLSWGSIANPNTAGSNGFRFTVQIVAPFTGKQNCGVSQTMTHGNSNAHFINGTVRYLNGGYANNGITANEPVLNAKDPFASTNWNILYKDGEMSWVDVPSAGPGDEGYIDFETCFYSKRRECSRTKCCVVWRWTVDFTGNNKINQVTTVKSYCE